MRLSGMKLSGLMRLIRPRWLVYGTGLRGLLVILADHRRRCLATCGIGNLGPLVLMVVNSSTHRTFAFSSSVRPICASLDLSISGSKVYSVVLQALATTL